MKNSFKKLCLGINSSILDSINSLNENRSAIVFICDPSLKLLGTITDSDIRRGLGNNIDIKMPVSRIMNHDPISVSTAASENELREKFLETSLRSIPILTDDGELVDYRLIEEFSSFKSRKGNLLIMAGGFGLRMGGLTKFTPKPMLMVKEKPMIQHIIELAADDGFEQVFISTHYLAKKIQSYFGDGSSFGIKITYINEEKPLGTAGSFAKIPINEGPILITNADILSAVGYGKIIDFHYLNSAIATLAVKQHTIRHPFGVVRAEGIDFIECEEKPVWKTNINAGIYVLDAKMKSLIEKDECIDMPKLIERVKKNYGKVKIFPLYENWIDLGDADVYAKES